MIQSVYLQVILYLLLVTWKNLDYFQWTSQPIFTAGYNNQSLFPACLHNKKNISKTNSFFCENIWCNSQKLMHQVENQFLRHQRCSPDSALFCSSHFTLHARMPQFSRKKWIILSPSPCLELPGCFPLKFPLHLRDCCTANVIFNNFFLFSCWTLFSKFEVLSF